MTIVFFSLGNPQQSRHSSGHRVLEHLVEEYGSSRLSRPSSSLYSMATDGDEVYFVRSETYMNESNRALEQFFRQNSIRPGNTSLVILHDDFERSLPLVVLSPLKKKESHNGLQSIKPVVDSLATLKVAVMHIGIGPKPKNASSATMSKWVLAPFSASEQQLFDTKSLTEAENIARGVVTGEVEVS